MKITLEELYAKILPPFTLIATFRFLPSSSQFAQRAVKVVLASIFVLASNVQLLKTSSAEASGASEAVLVALAQLKNLVAVAPSARPKLTLSKVKDFVAYSTPG